jgi:1,4-dihydroxy-2-naphthoate octaprenyltransferase
MEMKLKIWMSEIRANFLPLSVVLIFLGTSIAWHEGSLNIFHAFLSLLGLLLLHISVNLLNEYFDYKTGVDFHTRRTPFSGGSGNLPAGLLEPASVFRVGVISFALAVPIGIYFLAIRGLALLPILLLGSICVLLYTPFLSRLGWPEFWAGLGLGNLPVLGAYFIQTGHYTLDAVFASIPSWILVHNLLFLNELPDVEADGVGRKRTLPRVMGMGKASRLYAALTSAVYIWILGGVIAGILPPPALMALLTVPFAVKAMRDAFCWREWPRLVSAMGSNVIVVLFTQLLLGLGYILAKGVGL